MSKPKPAINPSIAAAFALFDENGDGSLSVVEMQKVLQRPGGGAPLSDADVQNVINEFDANGDGVLQIEEFAVMWAPMLSDAENDTVTLDDEDATASVTTPEESELGDTSAPIKLGKGKKKRESAAASFAKKIYTASGSFRKVKGKKASKSSTVAEKAKGEVRGKGEPAAAGSGRAKSSKAMASAEPAEKLRSQSDLTAAAAAELELAAQYEARAAACDGDTFERRLGKALVENNENARQAVGGSKAALTELVRSWDKNGDSEISKIEFRQACRISLNLKASNEEIDTLFASFDADGSEKLDLKEIKPALRALQDAAAAGHAEGVSVSAMAVDCRKRAEQLADAAESMAAIERDEKQLNAAARAMQTPTRKLAGAIVRRNLKVDEVISKWPGVALVPGEPTKVTRPQFHKGLAELKVPCSVSEVDEFFDGEHAKPERGAPGKASLFLKVVIAGCVEEYVAQKQTTDALEKSLAALRRAAKSQQSLMRQQQQEAMETMRRAEEEAARLAAERQGAEQAAKAAKLASFKRKKEKREKEKEDFEARVAAKRSSWTALDEHYATTTAAPAPASAHGSVEA